MEFMICIEDRVNSTDPVLDDYLFKRGDVVVACPDGWNWSSGELTDPVFRIVRVDLPPSWVDTLISGDQKSPNPRKFRRQYLVNLDALIEPYYSLCQPGPNPGIIDVPNPHRNMFQGTVTLKSDT